MLPILLLIIIIVIVAFTHLSVSVLESKSQIMPDCEILKT